MTNIVEFPGLGLSFTVNSVAFTIGGIEIYWYGVLIASGLFLAVLFAFSQARRFGVDSDRMIDVVLIGVVCAIVCGRLYFVIFSDQQYNTFFDVIDIRSGGIAIYGGIIGAFIGAFIGCKWRKVALLPLFDLTGMGFLIGQSIGRWGNFTNQEAFGSNTARPWGMISPSTTAYLEHNQTLLASRGIEVDPYMPVHPTFFYESVWCALGFLLLFLYRKHRKFNGEIFLFYLIWYGAGRFVIEGFRTDSLMIDGLGLRVSQLVGILSVILGLAVWIVCRVKTAGKPLRVPEIPPRTAKVKLETESGVQVVEISWPTGKDTPSRAERLEMARQKLEPLPKRGGANEGTAGEAEAGDNAAREPEEINEENKGENENGNNH